MHHHFAIAFMIFFAAAAIIFLYRFLSALQTPGRTNTWAYAIGFAASILMFLDNLHNYQHGGMASGLLGIAGLLLISLVGQLKMKKERHT